MCVSSPYLVIAKEFSEVITQRYRGEAQIDREKVGQKDRQTPAELTLVQVGLMSLLALAA